MRNTIRNLTVKEISFRKDINFLRAIAVLAVVIYHFNKDFLKGGWLGVDLFFFISGYLISNKLIVGLRKNKKYISLFFKKRFLRLTPALISTSVLSTIFFFNFLSPEELKLHLESSFYSLAYISNFFFSNLDFYSSPQNKYLTMLHTWSLGIEEQFYLLLPICVYFLFRKNKKIFISFLFLFSMSIIFNIFLVSEMLFYNPIARFWEFLAGALFMMTEESLVNKVKIRTSTPALIILISSFVVFGDEVINSVGPKLIVIGATIFFMKDIRNDVLINNSLLQLIGKISYSVYLFHQPIIAYMFIQNDKISELSYLNKLTLLLAIFIFSYLNWRFIENKIQSVKILFFIYLVVIIIFGLLIFDIPDEMEILNIPNKLFLLKVKDLDTVTQNGVSCNNRTVSETCYFNSDKNNKTVYVIGDSSFRTLTTALLENNIDNIFNVVHFTGNDCLFIFYENPSKDSCPNKDIIERDLFGMNIKDSIIIYGGRFPRYFSGEGFDNGMVKEINDITVVNNLKLKIKETLDIFSENNNTIFLIYPIPEQGWNVPELIYYKNISKDSTVGYPQEIWVNRERESKLFLDSIDNKNIIRVYPADIFCKYFIDGTCVGSYKGKVFYADDDHLSLEGSRYLADLIVEKLLEN